jgi:selenocysteine lyase/cysteine desulfurase
MIPLREIIDAVHRHSAAMIALDVTQALGRVPLDLTNVDLVISSTHKWILASHGGGLVGVPKSRREEWTVPAGGWFNLTNAFEADRFERAVSKPGAQSFTVGMPNYAAVYAINAGLKYIQSVGVKAIADHADPLVQACLDGIKQLPVKVITPDTAGALAGIIAFQHPKADEINHLLHEKNIHIMSNAGRLRVAIHGYNTHADVEQLLSGLKEALDNV